MHIVDHQWSLIQKLYQTHGTQVWSRSGMLRSALAQQPWPWEIVIHRLSEEIRIKFEDRHRQTVAWTWCLRTNMCSFERSHAIYSVVWSPDCQGLRVLLQSIVSYMDHSFAVLETFQTFFRNLSLRLKKAQHRNRSSHMLRLEASGEHILFACSSKIHLKSIQACFYARWISVQLKEYWVS